MHFLCDIKTVKNGTSKTNSLIRIHRDQSPKNKTTIQDSDQPEQRIQKRKENCNQRGLQAIAIKAKWIELYRE